MSDQWFYRMFGEEFGPVSLDDLKQLATQGTLSADDDVRSKSSQTWIRAGSLNELELEKSSPVVGAVKKVGSSSEATATRKGVDDWYCRLNGQEIGPLSFDELTTLAEQEHLTAENEVKLGSAGKWRRVGSIGRLMAVLPYQAAAPTVTKTVATDAGQVSAVSPLEPTASITTSNQALQEQATQFVAWAFSPNVDPYWWGWIAGVEYGPVDFRQILHWATTGQLSQTDFVRNGLYGQYCPAVSVPGLYAAASLLAQITTDFESTMTATAATPVTPAQTMPEAVPASAAPVVPTVSHLEPIAPATSNEPAKPVAGQPAVTVSATVSQQASAKVKETATPPTTAPVAKPAPTESEPKATPPQPTRVETKPASIAPAVSAPAPKETPTPPTAARSLPPTPALPAQTHPILKPTAPLPKPIAARTTSSISLSERLEVLRDPKGLGAMAVLAVLLLSIGWQYLPKSRGADTRHYHELKHVLDEIQLKQLKKDTDFSTVIAKAKRVSAAVTADLKDKASSSDPCKQFLLWAARDELPRLIADLQTSPGTQSKSEEVFEQRLYDAAKRLGLE